MLRQPFAPTLAIILMIACDVSAQRSPATRPSAKDAATLIKKIRADEAWFSQATSLSFKVTSTFERSRQQVAQRTRDIGPLERMNAIAMKSIIPAGTVSSTFELDKARSLFVRQEKDDPIPGIEIPLESLHFFYWDGQFSFWTPLDKSGPAYHRGTSRPSDLDRVRMGLFWPLLSAGATGMLNGDREQTLEARSLGFYPAEAIGLIPAEDFTLGGTQVVNGVNCQIVRTPLFSQELYISLNDQRLTGVSFRALTPHGGSLERTLRQYAVPTAGRRLPTSEEYIKWYSDQPLESRKKIIADYRKQLFSNARPSAELTYSDFREVAPGCWIPGKSVLRFSALNKASEPYVYTRWESKLEDVSVNQPLPDVAFESPAVDGTTVIDARFGAAVQYPYRKGMTDREAMGMPAATAPRRGGAVPSAQQSGARRSGAR